MKRKPIVFLVLLTLPLFSLKFKDDANVGVKTVVIDAGHGGKDPGCFGSGSREKDIALAISLKLGNFIETNFEDVKVIYTRKTDKFLELHERAEIANRNNADLFICIHANSSQSASASGTETYVMGLHRSVSNLNVAKRENAAILQEDNYELNYGGFDPDDDESYIALSLMQSSYLEQSLRFADKVQKQFAKLERRNRGVKQAGFLVLYKTTMPSVLIETGFLTNRQEEKFLLSEANQEKMASAVFEAFKNYKKDVESRKIVIEEKKEETGNKTIDLNADADLIFRIQIASSVNPVDKSVTFGGLKEVGEFNIDGVYKYMVGNETDFETASKLQHDLREQGYKGAFIVPFHNGDRIEVSEALELIRAQKTN